MYSLLAQIFCCNILSRSYSHLLEIFSLVAEHHGRRQFGRPLQKSINIILNIYMRQNYLLHDWSINYRILENMPKTIFPFFLNRT